MITHCSFVKFMIIVLWISLMSETCFSEGLFLFTLYWSILLENVLTGLSRTYLRYISII